MSASYDLLDKKELRITDVHLDGADLSELADAAAEVLDMAREEVLVTDYLDRVLTFDILRPTLYPHQLLDRQDALLTRLGSISGVRLGENARVASNGILGWIAADGRMEETLRSAERIAEQIAARVSRRAVIFSTGGEVVAGEIRDTNRETITGFLEASGFLPEFGGALRDDTVLIAGAIRAAVHRGHGLVVTTGGVGAEDKDRTVDAALLLDPEAATPYLCHFEPGHGRHVRDGVRIAVAEYEGSRIVCLPGPNDEVRAAMEVLIPGLDRGWPAPRLAEAIAERLRGILRTRMSMKKEHDHR
ncbi:molybdenum cofactor synthesis domain-containing protein [Actinocorallia herbida]|uniref:Molybdenum cofactor synthesis domain-containing protein n=1 Tax=Actinocorallia herbida TaxID=58109 RepID=A0A3N1D346_9ACTN|nr:molybdopterin-binding protein [Actinocorallia herbida]ROO87957.1 molybdenum cofactor synthesis domain-containing protein [Actinocorallia herbida]